MKGLNRVQLIGRLGQDPEVTITERGTTRTTFSVATSPRWTDVDGQAQTDTEWSRCVVWGKVAEVATEYLHTGSRVYVQGRLHTSRWEDADTGAPHSSVEIVVDDLILLDRPTDHRTRLCVSHGGAVSAAVRAFPGRGAAGSVTLGGAGRDTDGGQSGRSDWVRHAAACARVGPGMVWLTRIVHDQ